jgi:hypothetical protein
MLQTELHRIVISVPLRSAVHWRNGIHKLQPARSGLQHEENDDRFAIFNDSRSVFTQNVPDLWRELSDLAEGSGGDSRCHHIPKNSTADVPCGPCHNERISSSSPEIAWLSAVANEMHAFL